MHQMHSVTFHYLRVFLEDWILLWQLLFYIRVLVLPYTQRERCAAHMLWSAHSQFTVMVCLYMVTVLKEGQVAACHRHLTCSSKPIW